MNGLIHRNNALKEKILASNVLMGQGNDKTDTVEKRITDLEESGGGGGANVKVTSIIDEGVHIATIKVNSSISKIYAPKEDVKDVQVNGVSVVEGRVAQIDLTGKQDKLTPGNNVTIDSHNVISAKDTTYSDFVGATSYMDGQHGLVPSPTISDRNKYLKGDGTWGEINVPSGVTDVLVDGTSVVTGGVAEIDSAQLTIGFVTPYSISTSTIADGGSNNVMNFMFTNTAPSNKVMFNSMLNFNVATTYDSLTDTYGDCVLTITFKLDGINVASMQETYGDGYRILTLNYLIQNLSVGTHTFVINFAVTGGSIS